MKPKNLKYLSTMKLGSDFDQRIILKIRKMWLYMNIFCHKSRLNLIKDKVKLELINQEITIYKFLYDYPLQHFFNCMLNF